MSWIEDNWARTRTVSTRMMTFLVTPGGNLVTCAIYLLPRDFHTWFKRYRWSVIFPTIKDLHSGAIDYFIFFGHGSSVCLCVCLHECSLLLSLQTSRRVLSHGRELNVRDGGQKPQENLSVDTQKGQFLLCQLCGCLLVCDSTTTRVTSVWRNSGSTATSSVVDGCRCPHASGDSHLCRVPPFPNGKNICRTLFLLFSRSVKHVLMSSPDSYLMVD